VLRLKKAGGRPDIFTIEALDMIYKFSRGIPRTINLLCDSALVYGFADEAARIDTRIIKIVINELGFLGLYDTKHDEKASAEPAGHKTGGNGFIGRIEKLEGIIQKMQLQVNWQNAEIERRLKRQKKAMIEKFKAHLQNERRRSITLIGENERLKQKLRELKTQI
jgi:general secretion pathway protein A